MSVHFVSRHSGATEWIKRQGIAIDHFRDHLELDTVEEGDTVIGTLPLHVAAAVCERGATFLFLSLDTPPSARGSDLSVDQMEKYGARLEQFVVTRVP